MLLYFVFFWLGGAVVGFINGENGKPRSYWDIFGALLWPALVVFVLVFSAVLYVLGGKPRVISFFQEAGVLRAASIEPRTHNETDN